MRDYEDRLSFHPREAAVIVKVEEYQERTGAGFNA
jgi:hypothetical protein